MRAVVTAALLAVAGLFVATLCFRVAVTEALPADSQSVERFAPHAPTVVLDRAATALVVRHGILDTATLAGVRDAARAAPLDARAFLVLGHQQLLDREPAQALATLEAAQRLDPRDRVVHLLLLDRYLRARRYADAAGQFSVEARLVGGAGGPIAAALAQMSLAPETRDAVRRTLATDPRLEQQVLVALAHATVAPAAIFGLASPLALRTAGAPGNWGPALVDRLVAGGRYGEARGVWQRIARLPDAAVAGPIYDPGFQGLAGSAPFNWTPVAGGLGAADLGDGALAVDYYGRDSGPLASQLLVLRPGTYRFGFAVEGNKVADGPSLVWTLRCAVPGKPANSGAELMNARVAAIGKPHRETAMLSVPAGCPAQLLALAGNAGEFPTQMSVTLRDLSLQPAEARP